jgi:dihydrofolate reductase
VSVTLDGFIEGPNQKLDHTAGVEDADFDRYATEMLNSIDAMLLGRRTYQVFESYWPSATGPDAERMNELAKVVFSRTLEKVAWNNSRLVRENIAEEVSRLKEEQGKDLALIGSAELASTLIGLRLIEEYRIFVTPFVLGGGNAHVQRHQ